MLAKTAHVPSGGYAKVGKSSMSCDIPTDCLRSEYQRMASNPPSLFVFLAIGRVYIAGQRRHQVNVNQIEVEWPDGEECLDGHIIHHNTDEETIAMAVNTGE
jgi:hypothetical protein